MTSRRGKDTLIRKDLPPCPVCGKHPRQELDKDYIDLFGESLWCASGGKGYRHHIYAHGKALKTAERRWRKAIIKK